MFADPVAKDRMPDTRSRRLLSNAGLRPTRQRLCLANMIFLAKNCHFTAKDLHEAVVGEGYNISFATVYNTLGTFVERGILQRLVVDGGTSYYDTNLSEHHHFYVEDEGRLIDLPHDHIKIWNACTPPQGYRQVGVQVTIRIRGVSRR